MGIFRAAHDENRPPPVIHLPHHDYPHRAGHSRQRGRPVWCGLPAVDRRAREALNRAYAARCRTEGTMWLGIDIGTGGSRALLVDERGGVRAGFTAPHEDMHMERPLWAEQRPANWWDAVVQAVRGVLAKAGVSGADVKAIGLSGQMHGLVILDGEQVIRPSLIWCDQRSQQQVDFVNAKLGREN